MTFIILVASEFIMKKCWILSKIFSASIEMIMHFCHLFYLCDVLFVSISYVELTNICSMKLTRWWHLIFLMSCWIQFARTLLRTFVSMFTKDFGPQFSFYVLSVSGFCIRIILAWQNWCRINERVTTTPVREKN
jgi:hypothetical protein